MILQLLTVVVSYSAPSAELSQVVVYRKNDGPVGKTARCPTRKGILWRRQDRFCVFIKWGMMRVHSSTNSLDVLEWWLTESSTMVLLIGKSLVCFCCCCILVQLPFVRQFDSLETRAPQLTIPSLSLPPTPESILYSPHFHLIWFQRQEKKKHSKTYFPPIRSECDDPRKKKKNDVTNRWSHWANSRKLLLSASINRISCYCFCLRMCAG